MFFVVFFFFQIQDIPGNIGKKIGPGGPSPPPRAPILGAAPPRRPGPQDSTTLKQIPFYFFSPAPCLVGFAGGGPANSQPIASTGGCGIFPKTKSRLGVFNGGKNVGAPSSPPPPFPPGTNARAPFKIQTNQSHSLPFF